MSALCERLAPERVDADGEALRAEDALEPVERNRAVAPAPGGADHHRRAEQLRRLNRDEPDGPARAEHEHAVARADLCLPGDRNPRGDPRNPGRRGKRRVDLDRQPQHRLAGNVHALREEARLADAAAVAEEVDERAVLGAADGLAPGRIRERRMAAVEGPVADSDVERIERHRLDADSVDVFELFGDLRRRSELSYLGAAHTTTITRAARAARKLAPSR